MEPLSLKISWYKIIASYFYLVTIQEIPSDHNPGLCLQMEAGKLLLNSQNANYSYGNLHKVFEEIFEIIELENHVLQKVLVLGLGTGSVIDIMQRQHGKHPEIDAIELDPAVIQYLPLWKQLDLSNTNIIIGDAFEKVKEFNKPYNLILVDLFKDLEVCEGIHNKSFLLKLKNLLKEDGTILINYVINTPNQKKRFNDLQILLMEIFGEIRGHEILGMNRVLELKKTCSSHEKMP